MTARALSPDAPGEEAAARRDAGVSLSPLPWRLREDVGVIHDATGACVAVLGDHRGFVTPTDLANGRAIVAAANTLGGRHV